MPSGFGAPRVVHAAGAPTQNTGSPARRRGRSPCVVVVLARPPPHCVLPGSETQAETSPGAALQFSVASRCASH